MEEFLTPKQSIFVIEYLIDLNATQAAIRAGYSEDSAASIGQENLIKPEISKAIQDQMDARAQRTLITADYVISTLAEVVERCMQRAPVMVRRGKNMDQLVDEDGRHVWKFDSAGANKALENLARHLKLLTDKTELTGENGASFVPGFHNFCWSRARKEQSMNIQLPRKCGFVLSGKCSIRF